jgi:hypothetical protein
VHGRREQGAGNETGNRDATKREAHFTSARDCTLSLAGFGLIVPPFALGAAAILRNLEASGGDADAIVGRLRTQINERKCNGADDDRGGNNLRHGRSFLFFSDAYSCTKPLRPAIHA